MWTLLLLLIVFPAAFLAGLTFGVHKLFGYSYIASIYYIWEEMIRDPWLEWRHRDQKIEDLPGYDAMKDYVHKDVEATERMFRSDRVEVDQTMDLSFDFSSWLHSEMSRILEEELDQYNHVMWLETRAAICLAPDVEDFVLVSGDSDKPRCPNCAEILTKRANGVS